MQVRKTARFTQESPTIYLKVWQHKNDLAKGFTNKYQVHKLVYFEETSDVLSAIAREKQIKKWRRQWKLNLIEQKNPDWKDLYDDIIN